MARDPWSSSAALVLAGAPRALAGVAMLALLGCGAPQPSREPLGVGPLAPGYRLAHGRKPRREDRIAKAETPAKVAEVRPAAADGGTPTAPLAAKSNGAHEPPAPPDKTTPEKAPLDAARFVGDYRGEDVSTYRMRGVPERSDKDPNARVTVASADKASIDIVLVDSSNGKDICTLHATLGEASATITPGQKCFEQSGEDSSATATIRTGTATVDGRRLVLDLSLDFEMHVTDQDTTGTLEYHFDGTRR